MKGTNSRAHGKFLFAHWQIHIYLVVDPGTHKVEQRAKEVPGPNYCLHQLGRANSLAESLHSAKRVSLDAILPMLLQPPAPLPHFSCLAESTPLARKKKKNPLCLTDLHSHLRLPFLSWMSSITLPNFEKMHVFLTTV